ncbi:histidine kinase [Hymenobacter sp. HMF4947]|uniref:histidine kinase n=1 Tax=Hymenobacter ginkgonis TaxID=2682976 RepID=A0A7K1TGQ2_9BACT|nr:HAMP domain-containing sensor histidine kinase [Hymenobacter ginkgonis]MVN77564.1 histidine kinase [Hymenobacter ginkgonis]
MLNPPALPGQWLRSLLLSGLWLLAQLAAAGPPTPPSVRVERLPPMGLLLAKGWRAHAGDNPAWSQPDFDERDWDTLNPTRPRRELPPALSTGISWLRLRVQLGDSLRLRAPLLSVNYLGAVEVYYNGHLLRREGGFSGGPTEGLLSRLRAEPIALPTSGGAEGVLAVRLAPYHPWLQRGVEHQSLCKLTLQTERQLRQLQQQTVAYALATAVMAGGFLLLTLLHLVFFYYNPAKCANRYFARYTLTLAMALAGLYSNDVLLSPLQSGWVQWWFLVIEVLVALSGLYAVRALYALFGFSPGRLYAGLWLSGGCLLVVAVGWLYLPPVGLAFVGFMVVTTLEQLRLTSRALRQRQRGAGIIATGFAVALLALLLLVAIAGAAIDPPGIVLLPLFTLVFLASPLGISLFLAREFALDAELLQVKLREVERLSAQALVQEQEKQALLASQNETLEHQVQQRTGELQRSLADLRTAQAQLIQKEKMASLGELTAGIAHEIQNPLNFVTNFADVSQELLQESKVAQAAGDAHEVAALTEDIIQNLRKINEHGQRASSIVRGMLAHSRASSGERQPVDVNALCEEYLHLAYHGLRAKNQTLQADLKTDFAPQLPTVKAVPGDLGRVLLNLFTNAFYAVQQRHLRGESGYVPTVSVQTRHLNQQLEIQVQDNGTGMSAAIQAKIFQPFYTTKPAGEGTGLGLSLSYDIITKGYGGTLTCESWVGQGSRFCLHLPLPDGPTVGSTGPAKDGAAA